MKKFVLTVLTVLTCGALQALPAGNPADASLYTNNFWFGDSSCDPCDPCGSWCDMFDIRLGFYGDYVFNRHLHAKNTDTDVQTTTLATNAGLIVVNLCDWIDLFGTIGVTSLRVRTTSDAWQDGVAGLSNVMTEFDFSSEMSYSGGIRATLWNCDCFYVGAEAQYFYTNTSANWFLDYPTGGLTYFNNRNASYQEWQVAVGCAYMFVNSSNFAFIPYANIEVSGVNWSLDQAFANRSGFSLNTPSLKADKVVGWSMGMTALLCDLIGVTVEGRWANEKAIHVNGQLSF